MTDNASNQLADLPLEQLVGCHECDLLMLKPSLGVGGAGELHTLWF